MSGSRAHYPLGRSLRTVALKCARRLQSKIEGDPKIGSVFPEPERVFRQREEVLWRVAYAFFRLDQLPKGGWARSMAQWMDAIWEGDHGTIIRDPRMRTIGGVDLTCYAVDRYVHLLRYHLAEGQLSQLISANQTVERMRKLLRDCIEYEGGILVGAPPVGAKPLQVRLRHTVFSVIALLRYGEIRGCKVRANREVELTLSYVEKYLPKWKQDKSHLFASLAGAIKLRELLNSRVGYKHLPSKAKRDRISRRLIRTIHQITAFLDTEPDWDPMPPNTLPIKKP